MYSLILILLLSCVFHSEVVYSQAATASLFSEMLSINPATVGARTIGVFSVSPKIDKIEKLQDAPNGFSSSSSVNIFENLDVKAGTFFYGGKAGALTSELYVEIAKGEKIISISSGTEGNEVKLAGDNKFLRYNLAFKKFFGIGLEYMDFNNSTEFTTRFQGQSFSDSNKGENTITMIRPGFAFELFSDFGLA